MSDTNNKKGRIFKRWINLDPTDPQGLTANDIPYDEYTSLKDQIDLKLDQGIPIPVSQVGDLTYLPLDIKSSFKGNALAGNSIGYFVQEKDGSIVGLRTAWDGLYQRLLYCYSLSDDISKLYLTDIEYRPTFLAQSEYIESIIDGNQYGFSAYVRDYNDATIKYPIWVNTNGTLNGEHHTKVDIPSSIVFDSIVYAKESDVYITLTLSTNALVISCYDKDFNLIGSNQWFNILDESNCTIKDYNGISYTSVIYNVNTKLQYAFDPENNRYNLYAIYEIKVQYGSDISFSGHINLRALLTIDKVSNSISLVPLDQYPLIYDPSNPSDPCFPDSTLKENLIKFYAINDNTVLAYIQYENDTTKFRVNKYSIEDASSIQDTYNKLLGDNSKPFTDLINNPYLQNSREIIPIDTCPLGKQISYMRCISENEFLVNAVSTLPISDTIQLQEHQVKVKLDFNSEQQIDGTTNALGLPISIDINDNKSIDVCNISVITSSNEQFGYYVDLDNNSIIKVDPSNQLSLTDVVLPNNFNDLVNTQLMTDPDAANSDTVKSWIYYIGDNYFIASYILWNSTTKAYDIKFTILQLSGTTLSVVSEFVPVYSGQTNDPSQTGPVKPSAGVYIDTATSIIRCLFMSYPKSDNDIFNSVPIILSFDGTSHALQYRILDLLNGNRIPSCTINSLYGPMCCQSFNFLSRIEVLYIDETSTTDLTTRLQTAFDSWISASTTPSSKYFLTIKAPEGFNLYIPEAPVFIRGYERKLIPTQINLEDELDVPVANSKFYLYTEMFGSDLTLRVSQDILPEYYTRIQLAEITTDDTSITNVKLRPSARIAIYSPSREPINSGIPVADENGHIDRRWFPNLLEAQHRQYYPANNPSNSIVLNQFMQAGVAQLVEVTSQLYNIAITFPKPFNSPPVVLASITNASDGYTGSGGLDSVTTWMRFEVCNITTTGCTLSLSFGDAADGLTIFAHWVAIGS